MQPPGESILQYLEDIYEGFRRFEARNLTSRRNLSIGEWHIIAKIGPRAKRRLGDLASAMGVTMASMTVAVSKLEKKGCLQRERAPDDRRGVLVSLTRRGEAAFRVHSRFHKKMMDTILEGMDQAQLAALVATFALLKGFVDTY